MYRARKSNWQPTATIETLRQRAQIIQQIRSFFSERGVLEVETPALSHATVTDVHLDAMSTEFCSPASPTLSTLYLQTSPEYAMKRLLCAGSGCIFQLCKAFRNDELGRLHNPEFSMLEWYRIDFDHVELMAEVNALLKIVLNTQDAEQMSYQQAFLRYLNIDPLEASLADLKQVATEQGFANIADTETNPDTLLQLLFSQCIEPNIGLERPCFIYHFPANQAALARLEPSDCRIARRFEVYFKGYELANGYHELSDYSEQVKRFSDDNQQRLQAGLPQRTLDQHFLSALEQGLPDCSGVALGIDRLLMLALNASDIRQVMAFSIDNA